MWFHDIGGFMSVKLLKIAFLHHGFRYIICEYTIKVECNS